ETQNIAIPLTLVGGTSSAHKNLYIDTARGDIISHIGIGRTNQYVDLVKQGLGTLTLYGNNNISSNNLSGGRAIIQGGRLLVDYSPGLTSHFYVSKIRFEGNSGTFEVKGTPVNSTA